MAASNNSTAAGHATSSPRAHDGRHLSGAPASLLTRSCIAKLPATTSRTSTSANSRTMARSRQSICDPSCATVISAGEEMGQTEPIISLKLARLNTEGDIFPKPGTVRAISARFSSTELSSLFTVPNAIGSDLVFDQQMHVGREGCPPATANGGGLKITRQIANTCDVTKISTTSSVNTNSEAGVANGQPALGTPGHALPVPPPRSSVQLRKFSMQDNCNSKHNVGINLTKTPKLHSRDDETTEKTLTEDDGGTSRQVMSPTKIIDLVKQFNGMVNSEANTSDQRRHGARRRISLYRRRRGGGVVRKESRSLSRKGSTGSHRRRLIEAGLEECCKSTESILPSGTGGVYEYARQEDMDCNFAIKTSVSDGALIVEAERQFLIGGDDSDAFELAFSQKSTGISKTELAVAVMDPILVQSSPLILPGRSAKKKPKPLPKPKHLASSVQHVASSVSTRTCTSKAVVGQVPKRAVIPNSKNDAAGKLSPCTIRKLPPIPVSRELTDDKNRMPVANIPRDFHLTPSANCLVSALPDTDLNTESSKPSLPSTPLPSESRSAIAGAQGAAGQMDSASPACPVLFRRLDIVGHQTDLSKETSVSGSSLEQHQKSLLPIEEGKSIFSSKTETILANDPSNHSKESAHAVTDDSCGPLRLRPPSAQLDDSPSHTNRSSNVSDMVLLGSDLELSGHIYCSVQYNHHRLSSDSSPWLLGAEECSVTGSTNLGQDNGGENRCSRASTTSSTLYEELVDEDDVSCAAPVPEELVSSVDANLAEEGTGVCDSQIQPCQLYDDARDFECDKILMRSILRRGEAKPENTLGGCVGGCEHQQAEDKEKVNHNRSSMMEMAYMLVQDLGLDAEETAVGLERSASHSSGHDVIIDSNCPNAKPTSPLPRIASSMLTSADKYGTSLQKDRPNGLLSSDNMKSLDDCDLATVTKLEDPALSRLGKHGRQRHSCADVNATTLTDPKLLSAFKKISSPLASAEKSSAKGKYKRASKYETLPRGLKLHLGSSAGAKVGPPDSSSQNSDSSQTTGSTVSGPRNPNASSRIKSLRSLRSLSLSQPLDVSRLFQIKSDIRLNLAEKVGKIKFQIREKGRSSGSQQSSPSPQDKGSRSARSSPATSPMDGDYYAAVPLDLVRQHLEATKATKTDRSNHRRKSEGSSGGKTRSQFYLSSTGAARSEGGCGGHDVPMPPPRTTSITVTIETSDVVGGGRGMDSEEDWDSDREYGDRDGADSSVTGTTSSGDVASIIDSGVVLPDVVKDAGCTWLPHRTRGSSGHRLPTQSVLSSLPSATDACSISPSSGPVNDQICDEDSVADEVAQVEPIYDSRFAFSEPVPFYQHYNQEVKLKRMETFAIGETREKLQESLLSSSGFGSQRSLWCELPEVKRLGLLDCLGDQARKLQEAMFELITSEASYLRSLNVLLTHFMASKMLSGNPALGSVITRQERKQLFGNIISVRDSSQTLMNLLMTKLESNVVLDEISSVFIEHAQTNRQLDVYVKYCSDQIYQERTLNKLKLSNLEFLDALRDLEKDPATQSLNFRSFLMLPMQRITRYPLLLDAVLTRRDPTTPEYEVTKKALAVANKVVKLCNEGARNVDRLEQMVKLSRQLVYPADMRQVALVSQSRWIVKRGELVMIVRPPVSNRSRKIYAKPGSKKMKNRYAFLFTDLMLLTKKQKGSSEEYLVLDSCPRNMVEVSPIFSTSCPQVPSSVAASLPSSCHLFLCTFMRNCRNRQVEMLFMAETESDRERWVEALTPPKAENPDEQIYATWDCPQAVATHPFLACQEDELQLNEGDVVNVIRKMPDGWHEGERISDGVTGWFPGSFTKEILSDHVRSKNFRQRLRLIQAAECLTTAQKHANEKHADSDIQKAATTLTSELQNCTSTPSPSGSNNSSFTKDVKSLDNSKTKAKRKLSGALREGGNSTRSASTALPDHSSSSPLASDSAGDEQVRTSSNVPLKLIHRESVHI